MAREDSAAEALTLADAYGHHIAQAHSWLDKVERTGNPSPDRVRLAAAHATLALAIANGRDIWDGGA